jgi:hypothetical protein
MFGLPDAGDVSPAVYPLEHTSQALGPGEWICGPELAYRKDGVTRRFGLTVGPGDGFQAGRWPAVMPVFKLPDGTRLLRDGPGWTTREQSYTECAACPWARLSILALSPAGTIQEALLLRVRTDVGMGEDYDVEISADWRVVTEFRRERQGWRSTRHCLTGMQYRKCGEANGVTPPENRLLPRPVALPGEGNR